MLARKKKSQIGILWSGSGCFLSDKGPVCGAHIFMNGKTKASFSSDEELAVYPVHPGSWTSQSIIHANILNA